MSVSGIASSSFFNNQSANVQNQQQWQQELQKLGHELQAGSLSSPQATAQTTAQTEIAALQPTSQTSGASPVPSRDPGSPLLHVPVGTPKHAIHFRSPHHLHVDAGNDGQQDSTQPGQASQTGNASTAQQAYNSWQQDLQKVALNSDLLTAQSADWQPVSVSA